MRTTPGGEALDTYFGISTRNPQQPESEAARSDDLLKQLRAATKPSTGTNIYGILKGLSDQSGAAGVDPDALRALMKGARKSKGKPD